MILLDTHALVWMDSGSTSLGPKAASLLERAWEDRQLSVSAVSFRECAFLKSSGTHRTPPRTAAELTMQHKDLADRFIAATAIVHDATLVTAEKALLRWRSKLRPQHAGR